MVCFSHSFIKCENISLSLKFVFMIDIILIFLSPKITEIVHVCTYVSEKIFCISNRAQTLQFCI